MDISDSPHHSWENSAPPSSADSNFFTRIYAKIRFQLTPCKYATFVDFALSGATPPNYCNLQVDFLRSHWTPADQECSNLLS